MCADCLFARWLDCFLLGVHMDDMSVLMYLLVSLLEVILPRPFEVNCVVGRLCDKFQVDNDNRKFEFTMPQARQNP